MKSLPSGTSRSFPRQSPIKPDSPAFTPEAIIKAGQELQAICRNITGFALRQGVGGGDPNRLKHVWEEHVNQTAAKAEPVAEPPGVVAEEVAAVTQALAERISSLAIKLNDKVARAAERRVAEVVRAAGEEREQAERDWSMLPRRWMTWRPTWTRLMPASKNWKGNWPAPMLTPDAGGRAGPAARAPRLDRAGAPGPAQASCLGGASRGGASGEGEGKSAIPRGKGKA